MEEFTRKRLTGFVMFVFFLCGGIEYAIILPSLWPYLDLYFNSERWFYGLCFASFSISGLIFGPVFGYWSDRIKVSKPIVLFCNLFEIAGNFLYFASTSQYMVLGGRLIAGIGTGAGAAIFAMLARASTLQERTRVFAMAMSCRFIGLIIGPGLNALTSRITEFKLGPFTIDEYTSPGLLMTGVWVIIELLVLFLYYDLPALTDAEAAGLLVSESSEYPATATETDPLLGHRNGKHQPAPTSPPVSINEASETRSVQLESSVEESRPDEASMPWKEKILSLLREEWVVLMACQFILFFNQATLETLVVPLGKDLLNWTILDTSIFYCGFAAEAILCFVFLRYVSKYVQDRSLLLAGIVMETVGLTVFIIYLPHAKPENRLLNYVYLIVGSALGIAALTHFSVATTSLLTKFTSNEYQGTSQGVRRSVSFIAMIIGPLWAGAFLDRLTFMLAVMIGLVVMTLVMVVLSFPRLYVPRAPVNVVVDSASAVNA